MLWPSTLFSLLDVAAVHKPLDYSTAGGALSMEKCDFSAEAGDGRSVFQMTSNGQIQMPRMGSFCLSMVGDGAADADVALGADVSAASSSAQHAVKNAVDGDAHSFWASGSDPTSGVDLHIDLGATKQIRAVEIDWEYPAQACSTNYFVHIRWTILAYV